jgi:hypothetical protein
MSAVEIIDWLHHARVFIPAQYVLHKYEYNEALLEVIFAREFHLTDTGGQEAKFIGTYTSKNGRVLYVHTFIPFKNSLAEITRDVLQEALWEVCPELNWRGLFAELQALYVKWRYRHIQ